MEILKYIIIGAVGSAIGTIAENWLRKRIKTEFLCWILAIVIAVAVIAVFILIYHKLICKVA